MMKQRILLFVFGALALFAACKPDNPEELNTKSGSAVEGQWVLSAFSTKSVNVGGTDVDVYIEFLSGGAFNLYQQIGQGWYTKFTGTYSLEGSLLSGSYSDGKEWGSAYNVTVSDGTLVMTTTSGNEEYTYKSTTIPSSVLSMVH